jgi:hypothetical protein
MCDCGVSVFRGINAYACIHENEIVCGQKQETLRSVDKYGLAVGSDHDDGDKVTFEAAAFPAEWNHGQTEMLQQEKSSIHFYFYLY